eukprot:4349810-Amphidinium_carterae.1
MTALRRRMIVLRSQCVACCLWGPGGHCRAVCSVAVYAQGMLANNGKDSAVTALTNKDKLQQTRHTNATVLRWEFGYSLLHSTKPFSPTR